MSEFIIPSFKYGLDTRREQLSSVTGTLVELKNGYVNEGGDVVKIGRILATDTYAILDTTYFQTSLYPGIAIDITFYVFGSALEFGTTPTQSQPVLASAVPNAFIAVIYQQLKHPTLVNDTSITYDNTKHRMTSLVFSDLFNGKPLVVAGFADGNQFLYYDGTHVQQSSNGLVLSGRDTLGDLSDDLDRQFATIGWEAVANVDENAATQNGATMVKSPVADYFGGQLTANATNGVFGIRQFPRVDEDAEGTKAVAKFSITAQTVGVSTFLVEAPAQSTATTPTTILCGAAITALGSATLTATAIATAINDFSSDHGYTATSDTINVLVYAPLDYDLPPTGIELTVTETGGGTTGASISTGVLLSVTLKSGIPTGVTNTIQVKFNGNHLEVQRKVPNIASTYNAANFPMTVYVDAVVAGGNPIYTYAWSETSVGSANGIVIKDATKARLALDAKLILNQITAGSFRCLVSDSSGPALTQVVEVSVALSVTDFIFY